MKFQRRSFLLASLGMAVSLPASLATGQIQLSRPKEKELLPNPYSFSLSRDVVLDAVKQVLSDREIPLDAEKSKEKPGVLVTKTVVFTKGALTSGANLEYVARRPTGSTLTWIRGRFSLQIEATPVDPQRTSLAIYARIEGEYQSETGAQWVECPSRGVKENEILEAIIKHINGES